MDFEGKVILITGAASGIGLACAQHLASQGAARLLLIDRNEAALERMGLDCQSSLIAGDVADPDLWANADLGEIDHAIVNAGVPGVSPIVDCSFEEWRRVLSVNLVGAFLTLRTSLRAIRDGGSIVTVASAAGLKAEPGIAAYASSKAALIQLTKVAAKEHSGRRVRINAIAPGGVETSIWQSSEWFTEREREVGRTSAYAELARQATPLGRFAKPEEIAKQIAFLLSDSSATTTGSVFVSDGGYLL